MDSLAFRFANALVGNPEDAAGLEITLTGVLVQGVGFQVHSM